jgi:hypothetical protein
VRLLTGGGAAATSRTGHRNECVKPCLTIDQTEEA